MIRTRNNATPLGTMFAATVAAVGLAALVGLSAGCVKKQSTVATDNRPQQPISDQQQQQQRWEGADLPARVGEARRRLEQVSLVVNEQLPGRTEADDRRVMQGVFTDWGQILAEINGPQQSESFKWQLKRIRTTAGLLGSMGPDLSVDAMVNEGLRSVHGALGELKGAMFSDQAGLDPKLQELGARLNELDDVRGAQHRSVVAQTAGQVNYVFRDMLANLSQRLGLGGAATHPSEPVPPNARVVGPGGESAPNPPASGPVTPPVEAPKESPKESPK